MSTARRTLAALGLLTVAGVTASVAIGATDIPLREVARALLSRGDPSADWVRFIVLHVRLPRACVGWLVGGALAVGGCALQSLFRNPLADPTVLGVSATAALFAQVVIFLNAGPSSAWLVPLAATGGAGLATLVLLGAIGSPQHGALETLVLTGVALGQVAIAGSSLLISVALADFTVAERLMQWLLGSLDGRTWMHVVWGLGPVVIGTTLLVRRARQLDALLFGDVTATSLGVDVKRLRREVVLATALLTGASVAIGGVIGFVGLIVPHALRRMIGAGHAALLGGSLAGGGVLVLTADLVARRVIAPAELQIGIVTAAVGAPCFVLLLRRRLLEARV